MLILLVNIHVKPECLDAFKTATQANARASLQEPGVARFEVCQQADDPTRFILMEAYRSPAGHAAHRETAHYALWRDTVNAMMASTRTSVKYVSL
jgi:quinol monooxygenase YgiN